MTSYSLAAIADRWRQYGRSRAVHPTLWDGSLVLATLGPQTTSERTTCRDYSGRNNHGTLTGAAHLPTWSNQSYRGQAFPGVTCDGSEDYIALPSCACFDISTVATSPFTLAMWVFPTALPTGTDGKCLFSIGTLAYRSFNVLLEAAGKMWFVASTNGTSWTINSKTTSAVAINRWSCLTVTRNASGVYSAYIDASNAGGSFTNASNLNLDSFSAKIAGVYSAIANWQTTGVCAATCFAARVLTLAEIRILARHPLAAYAVRLPEYFTFTGAPSSAKYWMWARQQSAQVIGGGIT
jgi:hypothetical protein